MKKWPIYYPGTENFIIVLGQQNVLQSSYLLCIFPNAIIRLAGYEIGFFFVQQFTAIHTAKVMACMNKLFNIHASAVMAARDHAEKQINGKSKQMFWFMTDFETKTVSLACKRCKLQVRYLLKRMKYPLPKAGEKQTLYIRPNFDLKTYLPMY